MKRSRLGALGLIMVGWLASVSGLPASPEPVPVRGPETAPARDREQHQERAGEADECHLGRRQRPARDADEHGHHPEQGGGDEDDTHPPHEHRPPGER